MADASKLIFLGTGSSTGVPTPNCVLSFEGACSVCADALQRGSSSTNYRTNPSILIVRKHSEGKRELCSRFSAVNNSDDDATIVQIDITKHFREQVLSSWCYHGVRHLDALVLSHTHADACFGLDDLRSVQGNWWEGKHSRSGPMPVHVSPRDMEELKCKFDYLMPADENSETKSDVQRMVSSIAWKPWYEQDHCGGIISAAGIELQLVPCYHGGEYIAYGFLFGTNERCCYLSDVKALPERSMQLIESQGTLDLLIVDCLFKHKRHNTHFCQDEALELIRMLQPQKALLTGLTHAFDHNADNAALRELWRDEGIDVQLAHDGLQIPLDI